jgi:hypothetical protein
MPLFRTPMCSIHVKKKTMFSYFIKHIYGSNADMKFCNSRINVDDDHITCWVVDTPELVMYLTAVVSCTKNPGYWNELLENWMNCNMYTSYVRETRIVLLKIGKLNNWSTKIITSVMKLGTQLPRFVIYSGNKY